MNKSLAILILGIVLVVASVFANNFFSNQTPEKYIPSQTKTNETNNKTTINRQKTIDGQKIEKQKVLRVIDGDTLELADGSRVRFLNMDTPETVKKDTAVMCYGKEASNYTKSRLSDKVVNLTIDKEGVDQYGRQLRFVFLDGVDTTKIENSFNAEMVKKGFARARMYSPNTTYKKDFETWQKQAQDQKIGVWNCPKPFVE